MTNQNNKSKEFKRKKMTLLLDGETIRLIKEYGIEMLGSISVSASVRAMAKEYGRRKQNRE